MSERRKSASSSAKASKSTTSALSHSGIDAAKRMAFLLTYIENDINSKVKEIDAKTDDEFKAEKERVLTLERKRIQDIVTKREKVVERMRKIQTSQMKNAARLRVLGAMSELVSRVLAEARSKLTAITEKEDRYKPFLERLILQGLYMLLDKDVVITCRRKDLKLVQAALPVAAKTFAAKTRIAGNVVVDQERFLPDECGGGVELTTTRGKKKVTNTLESRLELVTRKTLPQIRAGLFGANRNRKFKD
ncbi:V-type proton ATPase subunit E 1-like [Dermacentor albipictus]|uniref:V-type proton ATPase subunit E 1-like n=1 Tax=Dermacentor albipictus TaxID=60249 RepID=UPI0031FDD647